MLKIAIIGPESTGKSTLTKQLGNYFNAPVVLEYAREYVERLTEPYTYLDVCNIAYHQIEQEKYYEKQASSADFVFFDTELIITKIWFSYCYNQVPDFLTQQLEEKYFDLYLLCTPDLPWIPDKVREHGHDREYFFHLYKSEIEQLQKPFVIIDGEGENRLQKAIDACNQLLILD